MTSTKSRAAFGRELFRMVVTKSRLHASAAVAAQLLVTASRWHRNGLSIVLGILFAGKPPAAARLARVEAGSRGSRLDWEELTEARRLLQPAP